MTMNCALWECTSMALRSSNLVLQTSKYPLPYLLRIANSTSQCADGQLTLLTQERLVNTCLALRAADPAWHRPSISQSGATEESDDEEGSSSGTSAHLGCPITLKVIENDNKTSDEIKKVFSKKLKYRYIHVHASKQSAIIFFVGIKLRVRMRWRFL